MKPQFFKKSLFTRAIAFIIAVSFMLTSGLVNLYARTLSLDTLRPQAAGDNGIKHDLVDALKTTKESPKIIKRIGILTGGGPASGHNRVLQAALQQAQKEGIELVIIWEGWKGLVDDKTVAKSRPLTLKDLEGHLDEGGTVILTSRENPYERDEEKNLKRPDAPLKLWENIQKLGLNALITCGGDDTNKVSFFLQQEHPEFPIIGLPKTMDNDLQLEPGAQTYGYDTFIQYAAPLLEYGKVDAMATKRALVVEVFGRAAGFVAARLGANVGATRTLIPEEKDLDLEQLVKDVKGYQKKHGYALVVVSEGVSINKNFANNATILEQAFAKDPRVKAAFEMVKDKDSFGHPKLEDAGSIISAVLSAAGVSISKAGKIDYLVRSAPTTKLDTEMCLLVGEAAIKSLVAGNKGQLLYVHNSQVKSMPLVEKLGGRKFDYLGVDRPEYLKANQALLEASLDNGGSYLDIYRTTLWNVDVLDPKLTPAIIKSAQDMWQELKDYVSNPKESARDGIGLGYLYAVLSGQMTENLDTMKRDVEALIASGIKTVVYSGEGGQILGNRAVYEALGSKRGIKFIFANNLESRTNLKKELGDANTVLFIASSKGGATDETAFNTQTMIRYFIREFTMDDDIASRLIGKLQGRDITDDKFDWQSITTDEEKKILDKVAKHLLFTTTTDTKSALYKLATKFGKDEEDNLKVKIYPIPLAIGGRFSVLSESGMITSLLAGLDVDKMIKMVSDMEPVMRNHDPAKNSALDAALKLNAAMEKEDVKQKVLVGISNYGKLHSTLEWMGQLIMESLGKEGVGPYFITAEGKSALNEMTSKAEDNSIYFIINVLKDGEKVLDPITVGDLNDKPALIYNIEELNEESLAEFFLFSEELTIRYGLLNVARAGIKSVYEGTREKEIYRFYDPQDQLAVVAAKKAASAVASVQSKTDLNQREKNLINDYNSSPSLVKDKVTPQGFLMKNNPDINETVFNEILNTAVDKTGASADNDQTLINTVREIEKKLRARVEAKSAQEVLQLDEEINELYGEIINFGKGRQPQGIEELAQIGAKLLYIANQLNNKQITTLFLYSPVLQSDVFGEWWKILGRRAKTGMLYDYMMGTRDQHSRQQGLIDGPDLALTIFVRFVEKANEILADSERDERISFNGMASAYMDGLYPQEMLDTYFQGISDAFANHSYPSQGKQAKPTNIRDLIKIQHPTIRDENNLPELYRLFGRMNELYRDMLRYDIPSNQPRLSFGSVTAVQDALKGIVEAVPGGVRVSDEARLRSDLIDKLVYDATFNPNPEIVKLCRQLIIDIAAAQGAVLDTVYPLYAKKSKDKRHYSVPAINVRGMAYDTARAAIKSAMKNDVGAVIFEIAKSEIKYTGQRPAEFTNSILAAAIKEGYNRPVYLQADHFQVALKDYQENPAKAIGAIKDLIRESIEAGFYQVDLDMSPLVDFTQATPSEQQRLNYEVTAHLTVYVRQLERELGLDKLGIVVNLGGEIGEIGKGVDKKTQKNSTPAELRAFEDGYKNELTRSSKELGYTILPLTKVAIQTGTIHGGIRDAKGEPVGAEEISLSFSTLAECNQVTRDEYGQAGAVQHGASTLPDQFFIVFSGEPVPEGLSIDEKLLSEANKKVLSENPTAEVHLATAYQDTILDNKSFPVSLFSRIKEYILGLPEYKKELEKKSPEEAFASTRKNAWGKFKADVWNLPESIKSAIRDSLEIKFDTVFTNLGVKNSQGFLTEAKWGKSLAPFAEAFPQDINQRLSPEVMSINNLKEGKVYPILINHESLLKTSPDGIMALPNIVRQLGAGNIKLVLHVFRSDITTEKIDAIIDEDLAKINKITAGFATITRNMFAAVVVGVNPQDVAKQVKAKVGADIYLVIGPENYVEQFAQFEAVKRVIVDEAEGGTQQVVSMAKALKLGINLIPAESEISSDELKKLDNLFSKDDSGNFRVQPMKVTESVETAVNSYKQQLAEVEIKV